MKTTQKQTARQGNFVSYPKFAIPPELLILREVELLEATEGLGPVSRLHYVIRQRQRN